MSEALLAGRSADMISALSNGREVSYVAEQNYTSGTQSWTISCGDFDYALLYVSYSYGVIKDTSAYYLEPAVIIPNISIAMDLFAYANTIIGTNSTFRAVMIGKVASTSNSITYTGVNASTIYYLRMICFK